MLWQDYVITVIVVVFAAALVPQVYHGFKRKKGVVTFPTSISTCFGSGVISFVYLTLDLYFSAIMSFFVAVLWFILVMQRAVYEKV